MNSFQAISDCPNRETGRIIVEIVRDYGLGLDDNPPIAGFKICDNGIGFDDTNFDSFNTAFSEYRLSQGGKGLGRFTWLKAFTRVEVESVFEESDADGPLARKFVFDENYDPDSGRPLRAQPAATTGTCVSLVEFKEPYRTATPRGREQIGQRLIEHFLLIFLLPDCPKVEIHDSSTKLDLNRIFDADFRASASVRVFAIQGSEFTLHGFRLKSYRNSKHRLIYAANRRGVVSDNLADYIPNLNAGLFDDQGNPFVYIAVVQSPI